MLHLRIAVFCLLASVLSIPAVLCPQSSVLNLLPASTGDARFAMQYSVGPATNLLFDVFLPPGEWECLTVTSWLRFTTTDEYKWPMGLICLYTPSRIQRTNPDIANNFFHHLDSTNMFGTATIDPFPWQPYAPGVSSNNWPKGVYTVSGWSSNAVTVSVGGNEAAVGPGEFNRNVIAGAGSAVAVSGSGLVSLGISRTPSFQFFTEFLGQLRESEIGFEGPGSVSNELAFCVWRITLTRTQHIVEASVGRIGASSLWSVAKSEALPDDGTDSLSGAGLYRFGITPPGPAISCVFELFDARVFPYRLSDSDLTRIWTNALPEIGRRGIPRWK